MRDHTLSRTSTSQKQTPGPSVTHPLMFIAIQHAASHIFGRYLGHCIVPDHWVHNCCRATLQEGYHCPGEVQDQLPELPVKQRQSKRATVVDPSFNSQA
jgi:hypothetical protein